MKLSRYNAEFIYILDAAVSKDGKPAKCPAWRTSTPGLIVNVAPLSNGKHRKLSERLSVTHEQSGFTAFHACWSLKQLKAAKRAADSLGNFGIDWTLPASNMFKMLCEMPDERLRDFLICIKKDFTNLDKARETFRAHMNFDPKVYAKREQQRRFIIQESNQ